MPGPTTSSLPRAPRPKSPTISLRHFSTTKPKECNHEKAFENCRSHRHSCQQQCGHRRRCRVRINGRWDAVLTRNGSEIPFRLDIKGSGADLQGVFYDGFKPYDGTTNASFKDNKLTLNIEHYLTTINATLKDGALDGAVVAQNRESSAQYGFHAVRHVEAASANTASPNIAGTWVIPLDTPSSKGEKAFRLIVQQQGAEVAASILRIDGDTGAYSGTYRDGKWVLSHFDGGRPGVITVTPAADGTLKVVQLLSRPGAAAATAASYTAACRLPQRLWRPMPRPMAAMPPP